MWRAEALACKHGSAARSIAAYTWVQLAACQSLRKHHNLCLPPPEGIAVASTAELPELLPFSHGICSFRNRSFESRGMVVRFHPQVGPQDLHPSRSYVCTCCLDV